ncbi:MAG: tRNA pseudouridine(55) synthase TruB [Chloroflexi bacterium]|nr:tRNA pseudouridine(55) synthase TruB [Chloroflexota bacterium]
MDGILNINKPLGETSFGIVAMVKRLTGQRRVGHAGTLDPMATGVLPVCLGQGTRVIEFLADATKSYRAEIELGITTDTYDGEGQVVQRVDSSSVSRDQLISALQSFVGIIHQTPPMYSAVKHHGKPLYQLARAGITVERKSRPAKIHQLELVDWQPPVATLEVVCGKGTYIRSLAHDLGQTLGCGAYLKSLVRTRYGPFDLDSAISVPQLEEACAYGYWHCFVYPIDRVLLSLSAMIVGEDTKQYIRNGRPLLLESSEGHEPPPPEASSENCRAYDLDGCFFSVLRFNPEKRQWQPKKVFLS